MELVEALKIIKIKCHPNSNPSPLVDEALDIIEKSIIRLDTIDNTDSSEVLECVDYIEKKLSGLRYECERTNNHRCDDLFIQENIFTTIKQALIKAQKNEHKETRYKCLEEELGCPLDVLIKAVQDGVYYEDVANRMQYLPVDLRFSLDGDFILYCNDDEYLLVKNYKKTWWLKVDKSE